MPTKLTPIQHETLDDYHRVPVACVLGKYEVYVGDNFIRFYEEHDLPDIIKSRIAMIKANAKGEPVSSYYHTPLSIKDIYDGDRNSPMFEIGWWVAKELFVVVIPTKDLTYLRGEANNMARMGFIQARQSMGMTIMNDCPTYQHLEDFF